MTAMRSLPLRALTLTLTERCNLQCRYCYVPVRRGRSMQPAVADAAVDLLLEQAGGDRVSLFFFGGEPLLEQPLIERATERVRASAADRLHVEVGLTTNGTLLSGEALELCRDTEMRIALSADGDDGPVERVSALGADSTPMLRERLPEILALEPA